MKDYLFEIKEKLLLVAVDKSFYGGVALLGRRKAKFTEAVTQPNLAVKGSISFSSV